MGQEYLVTGVARQGDGRSYVVFGEAGARGWGFTRLVAPTPEGVLYPQEYQMQEMTEPRLWDVIRVEAPWADSRAMQPENRVVDHTPWELVERPAGLGWMRRLEGTAVSEGPLFGTAGRAVRVTGAGVEASIAYVEPGEVEAASEWDPRRELYRARMRFTLGRDRYDLPLTDLHYAEIVRGKGEGAYRPEQIGCRAPHGLRLLVTLGEPFHGWCYKMVMALLPRRTVTLMRDGTSQTLSDAVRHVAGDPMEHARASTGGA